MFEGPCFEPVKVGGEPAARVGDAGPCGSSGTADRAARGNPTVLIGGAAAVGMTHSMEHGGWIATGCGTVYIGNPPTDESGNLVPIPKECAFVWRLLRDAPDNLARWKKPAWCGPGKPGLYIFPHTTITQPSVVHIAVIRGHTVRIVSPGPGVAVAGKLPQVDEIVAGLATLNDEQLSGLDRVVLSPSPNPEDAHWQKKFEDPNFGSAATTWDRTVNVYPTWSGGDPASRAAEMRRVMQHEGGHAVAQQAWSNDPAAKEAWAEAMRSDRRSVTAYGAHNIDEDFAEAVLLFALTKDTPCEASARATFPARYALLEKMFPNGYGSATKGGSNAR